MIFSDADPFQIFSSLMLFPPLPQANCNVRGSCQNGICFCNVGWMVCFFILWIWVRCWSILPIHFRRSVSLLCLINKFNHTKRLLRNFCMALKTLKREEYCSLSRNPFVLYRLSHFSNVLTGISIWHHSCFVRPCDSFVNLSDYFHHFGSFLLFDRVLIVLIQSALAGAVEALVPVPTPALASLGGLEPCANFLVCYVKIMRHYAKEALFFLFRLRPRILALLCRPCLAS